MTAFFKLNLTGKEMLPLEGLFDSALQLPSELSKLTGFSRESNFAEAGNTSLQNAYWADIEVLDSKFLEFSCVYKAVVDNTKLVTSDVRLKAIDYADVTKDTIIKKEGNYFFWNQMSPHKTISSTPPLCY
jgi:hypothetical protein